MVKLIKSFWVHDFRFFCCGRQLYGYLPRRNWKNRQAEKHQHICFVAHKPLSNNSFLPFDKPIHWSNLRCRIKLNKTIMGQQIDSNFVVYHGLWTIHNNIVLDKKRRRQTPSRHRYLLSWFQRFDSLNQDEWNKLSWHLQNLLWSRFEKLRNCFKILTKSFNNNC